MRRTRRAYYDQFSRFYDCFVALHSHDTQGLARKFLADQLHVQEGGSVLDVCTGTATLLPHLQARVAPDGRVVGVDFSHGMLKVAHEKTRSFANVHLVEADAGRLPFAAGTFDAVTCSHAFYELKGETQNWMLEEVLRVLRPEGAFLMMEHDVLRTRSREPSSTSASPSSAPDGLLPSFATSRRSCKDTSGASRSWWPRPGDPRS